MKHRVLEPELLDSLPHDHPDAIASRSDIRFLNAAMGSFAWMRRQLAHLARPDDRIVELGAGDGALIHYLLERAPSLAAQWTGLDLAPPPADLPAGVRWVQGDFLTSPDAAAALESATLIVANLILHHFTDDQLAALAARFRSARTILISEPCRHVQHHWKARLLDALLGFNPVTTFDISASIRAGFRRGELPRVFGLDPAEWEVSETGSFFSACRMVAVRR